MGGNSSACGKFSELPIAVKLIIMKGNRNKSFKKEYSQKLHLIRNYILLDNIVTVKTD